MQELFHWKIKSRKDSKGFILDGFPRTIEQAKELDALLAFIGMGIDNVIYFDVPEKELITRLLGRAEQEGRSDDNLQTIQKRLSVFKEKTQPLLDYYKGTGKLKYITGTGAVTEVTNRLMVALGHA